LSSGQLGYTGRSPKFQRKAAAFVRWHEPDDARVSSPEPAHNEPVAVVLDLVHPVGPGRRLGGNGRDAGVNEAIGTNAAREHVV
jgi:hypothetical protein